MHKGALKGHWELVTTHYICPDNFWFQSSLICAQRYTHKILSLLGLDHNKVSIYHANFTFKRDLAIYTLISIIL